MKKGEALIIAAFLSSTVCAMSMYLVWTSRAVQSMINTLADAFPLLVTLTEAAIIAGLVFAIVKMGIHLYGYAIHIRHIYPDAGGAIPYVRQGDKWIDIVPPHVRLVQVLSDSHIAGGKKPNATAIREAVTAYRAPMLSVTPETIEDVDPNIPYPFDIGRVDPVIAPHWMFFGRTGSGKSTAAFAVFRQLLQRGNAEFIICEPGGVDWNYQADHITAEDIEGAIVGEYEVMLERQEILRKYDVNHISKLPFDMPYRYLVLEEAQDVLENLNDAEVLKKLRAMASMARKTGIGLFAITPSAMAKEIPTSVRNNLRNVFLFNGPQQIAEIWRVNKFVNLPSLQPGQAFDVQFKRTVQFQMTDRPNLKPDRQPPPDAMPRPDLKNRVVQPVVQPVVAPTTATTAVAAVQSQRLQHGRQPTPVEAQAMRNCHNAGMSKTGICERFWGYKDGVVWDHLTSALEHRL